ncbi:MAG: DUF1801 domain-containing protein [Planctomycetaceae bacterium]
MANFQKRKIPSNFSYPTENQFTSPLRSRDIGMAKFADPDAYIAAAPETMQPLLIQLRAQLAKTLPDAEEIMMYDLPGFGFGKTIIAGYAAFSKQCGLYVSKSAITAFAPTTLLRLDSKFTKTGVTFSPSKPIPDKLVKTLAIASRKELTLITTVSHAADNKCTRVADRAFPQINISWRQPGDFSRSAEYRMSGTGLHLTPVAPLPDDMITGGTSTGCQVPHGLS